MRVVYIPGRRPGKMHLHSCFNTFPKPIVTIFLAKSEYTHEKMGIQHTMLPRGAYTPYTIQTGVYTAFSISRGGIYTIQFTFPTPSSTPLQRQCAASKSHTVRLQIKAYYPRLKVWSFVNSLEFEV